VARTPSLRLPSELLQQHHRSVTSFRIAAGPAVRKLLLHQVSPEVKQQRRAELERPAVRLVVRASGSLQEPIEVSAKPLLL
jgi:hypothetical protein